MRFGAEPMETPISEHADGPGHTKREGVFVTTKRTASDLSVTTADRTIFVFWLALLVVPPFAIQRVGGEPPASSLEGSSLATTQRRPPRSTMPATEKKPATIPDREWPNYGNDPGGMRFSPLTGIDRRNVAQLKVAWVFHTGDISDGRGTRPRSGFETTPILVDGTLFLTTPFNRVIALDPETGKQRWAFDPKIDENWQSGDGLINRGLATWLDSARAPGTFCRRRLFEATIDARLIALDAATGKACADFGQKGEVSLRDVPGFRPVWYHMTSPPAVVDDVVVVGSAIDDNARVDMPSGVVRAFDARTGALLWSWDPISSQSAVPSAGRQFLAGAGNAWSIMTVDPERHLVLIPTGSASPDYFGGLRPGEDKWANSVVALRARTGELVWGFQLVHHDLWDYDVATPPLLATVEHDGKNVPVVIVGDKSGFLYVLNRDTGIPVFPVKEQVVPKSDVPEEVASPTQPVPVAPPALVPQRFTVAWGATPEDYEACRKEITGLRTDGVFTPPSVQGIIAVPGNVGGMNWSGYAFDPQRGLLIANANNLPYRVKLIPRASFGQTVQGSSERLAEQGEYARQAGAPYGMFRRPLLSPGEHLPCVPPPWGTLVAVDMVHGTIRWQVPLGTFGPGGPAGTISLGGPIVTAGDLIFIAGTAFDPHVRAFDVETGRELWKAELPAPGHATPMTYEFRGKQYLVIAAGGHSKITEEPLSDALVAFALP
jgi:quinoprotein glucose dehydrogenase